jgi:hypothetical protein
MSCQTVLSVRLLILRSLQTAISLFSLGGPKRYHHHCECRHNVILVPILVLLWTLSELNSQQNNS